MGEVYDTSEGARFHVVDPMVNRPGPPILLDISFEGRAAVDAMPAPDPEGSTHA